MDLGPGKGDDVSSPDHYSRLNPQPITVISSWKLNFARGAAVKYLARAGFKGSKEDEVKDLQKAASYIMWEIDRLAEEKNA